jgi:hypothetical protein
LLIAKLDAGTEEAALLGQVEELNQKVQHLEDAGCAICLQAPLAPGFLHGGSVHR